VRRDGAEFELTITPTKIRPDIPPGLGISNWRLTRLAKMRDGKPPTIEGTPARRATPPFAAGDEVVKIGEREIQTYRDVVATQVVDADRTLPIVVRRRTIDDAGNVTKTEDLTIEVA